MTQFLLFAVPATFWDDRPRASPPTRDELLREQLREARALRERIAKGVNLESERNRITDALGRIESEIISRSYTARNEWNAPSLRAELALGRFPALELDEGYLHLLAAAEFFRANEHPPGILVPANPLALGESIYQSEQLAQAIEVQLSELAKLQGLSTPAVEAARRRMEFYKLVRDQQDLGG
jgi:hypothetical protein